VVPDGTEQTGTLVQTVDDPGSGGTDNDFTNFVDFSVSGTNRAPLSQTERLLKRLVDIVCSVGAIIALLPIFLIVALSLKLDSTGPVLLLTANDLRS
jgi:lipopolysaccharide/colanic/teichoic acid biosynthesis glycosyltransferase